MSTPDLPLVTEGARRELTLEEVLAALQGLIDSAPSPVVAACLEEALEDIAHLSDTDEPASDLADLGGDDEEEITANADADADAEGDEATADAA